MVLLGPNGILKVVRKVMAYSDWWQCLPFSWNYKKVRLEKKSKEKLKYHRIRLAISMIYMALSVIQVVRVFKGSALIVKTHSIQFLSCFIFCLSCHLVNYKELSNVIELFNSLIYFERRFTQLDVNFKRSPLATRENQQVLFLMKCFVYAMTYTAIGLPILYHLDILRMPCYPLYVGYWLSSQCDDKNLGIQSKATWSAQEIGTKLGISLASYFIWSFCMAGCLFQISLECIVHGHCLRSYIAEYGR